MTVTEVPAEYDHQAHAGYIAGLLAPEKVRRSALSCIVTRTTAEMLRAAAESRLADLEPVWAAWGAEIDLLAAHGVTGQTARDAAKIALVVDEATADDFRNPRAYQDIPEIRAWARVVADEMDALAAEGFDPAVYEKEINQACDGDR